MSDDFLDDDPTVLYDEGEQVTLALREIANATEQMLRERQGAYQRIFGDPARSADAAIVLADLGRFCRANSSAFRADAREHAALEGRREVWLRIRDHVDLRLDELTAKYTTGETS